MRNALAGFAMAAMIVSAWPTNAPAARPDWPAGSAEKAVAACRAAMLDGAMRDFAMRNKLSADRLPPDFREKVANIYEPMLNTCDCALGKIVEQTSYADFIANQARYGQKMVELTSAAGPCKAVAPIPR